VNNKHERVNGVGVGACQGVKMKTGHYISKRRWKGT